jgi:hypothetical protein
LIRGRIIDYVLLGSFAGFISGYNTFMFLPFFYITLTLPRRISTMNFLTFHAELLPHTEQVVFHKAGLFGNIRRIYVDVKNLEKIDASIVPSNPYFIDLISLL